MKNCSIVFLGAMFFTIVAVVFSGCKESDKESSKYKTIFDAARGGNAKAVQEFIIRDKKLINTIDKSTDYKRTPLSEALVLCADAKDQPQNRNGLKSVVYVLLDAGSDVNTRDKDDDTPLFHMAAKGDRELVELLILKGAKIDVFGKSGWTPLQKAVVEKQNEIVKLLLSKGCAVNSRDTNGDTALHSAAGWDNIEAIELLIAHGAEINAIDTRGRTPIDYAVIKSNKKAIEILKKHGGITKNTKAEVPTPPIAKPYIKK